MAQDSRAHLFGASPTFVELMQKAGDRAEGALRPQRPATVVLGRLAGLPPRSPRGSTADVKADLWVATGSGGTDMLHRLRRRRADAAGARRGDPGPVASGSPPRRATTRASPSSTRSASSSSPRRCRRCRCSSGVTTTAPATARRYFEHFPGVWRHGDFFAVNERGGCFVLGRSDAALNRHGVRIGTAEIYRVASRIDGVADAHRGQPRPARRTVLHAAVRGAQGGVPARRGTPAADPDSASPRVHPAARARRDHRGARAFPRRSPARRWRCRSAGSSWYAGRQGGGPRVDGEPRGAGGVRRLRGLAVSVSRGRQHRVRQPAKEPTT